MSRKSSIVYLIVRHYSDVRSVERGPDDRFVAGDDDVLDLDPPVAERARENAHEVPYPLATDPHPEFGRQLMVDHVLRKESVDCGGVAVIECFLEESQDE